GETGTAFGTMEYKDASLPDSLWTILGSAMMGKIASPSGSTCWISACPSSETVYQVRTGRPWASNAHGGATVATTAPSASTITAEPSSSTSIRPPSGTG